MRNPYGRSCLARKAFDAEGYDTSIGHLEYSVTKNKNEDAFCYLLGSSHRKNGDESAARQRAARAEQLARNDGAQSHYRKKLQKLLSSYE